VRGIANCSIVAITPRPLAPGQDRIREFQLSVSKNRNDFRFPDTHGSVGHGHIDQRKQPRQLDGPEFCLVCNVNGI